MKHYDDAISVEMILLEVLDERGSLDISVVVSLFKAFFLHLPNRDELNAAVQSLLERGLLWVDGDGVMLSSSGKTLVDEFKASTVSIEKQFDLKYNRIQSVVKAETDAEFQIREDVFFNAMKKYRRNLEETRKKYPPCPSCNAALVDVTGTSAWNGDIRDEDGGDLLAVGGMILNATCLACGVQLRMHEGGPSKDVWMVVN